MPYMGDNNPWEGVKTVAELRDAQKIQQDCMDSLARTVAIADQWRRPNKIAAELRALAQKLQQDCMDSPACTVAIAVVNNCCDHLQAIARVHEYANAKSATSD